jgi:hypothetical protein
VFGFSLFDGCADLAVDGIWFGLFGIACLLYVRIDKRALAVLAGEYDIWHESIIYA